IPVALGLTEGSEMRQPLAIAVIGGLMTALPLSLFVIPIFYMIIDKIRYTMPYFKMRGNKNA
ncbi:MAG: efflux RND transporter permease subunit, partial [Sulfurihydrogenibium sp.]|nr:efflux RND transporter permease subunit [Sulfurihydrogenibium sp.]